MKKVHFTLSLLSVTHAALRSSLCRSKKGLSQSRKSDLTRKPEVCTGPSYLPLTDKAGEGAGDKEEGCKNEEEEK